MSNFQPKLLAKGWKPPPRPVAPPSPRQPCPAQPHPQASAAEHTALLRRPGHSPDLWDPPPPGPGAKGPAALGQSQKDPAMSQTLLKKGSWREVERNGKEWKGIQQTSLWQGLGEVRRIDKSVWSGMLWGKGRMHEKWLEQATKSLWF